MSATRPIRTRSSPAGATASARCARAAASPASPSAPRANTTRSARPTPPPRSRPASAWPWRATSRGGNNNVIAVIGDGAMSAGMAYEAMNNAGALRSRLIVILNDNDMSIAPPVGAMCAYLARLVSGGPTVTLRNLGRTVAEALPSRSRRRRKRPRNSPAACRPAARCSRSWASTMSARSTATISTTCCRC